MSDPAPQARRPLGVIRALTAALGVIIMALSGGCTLFVAVPMLGGSSGGEVVPTLLVFGGVPFAFGLLLWLLAVKVGR